MGNISIKQWDIYIAEVWFEDLPKSKLRPVIILGDSIVTIDCIKMTSQSPRPGEYQLQKWKAAGLHKPTTARISKRLKLNPENLKKRISSLEMIDILEIQKRLTV